MAGTRQKAPSSVYSPHCVLLYGRYPEEKPYPFVLRTVEASGLKCSLCPWTEACVGCQVTCDETPFPRPELGITVAMDWDPSFWYLHYLSAAERQIDPVRVVSMRTIMAGPEGVHVLLFPFVLISSFYLCLFSMNRLPSTNKRQRSPSISKNVSRRLRRKKN